MESFYKFPSTPHLIWLCKNSVREDKVFTNEERENFLNNHIVVEEKIDGANIGISIDMNGSLIVQNRGGYITKENCEKQFTGIWSWIESKKGLLEIALSDQLILFGEWCVAKHSVFYNELPDWFVAFDVFEVRTRKFWSTKRRDDLCKQLDIATVPTIVIGSFTLETLQTLFNKSAFSDELVEGLYFRIENEEYLIERVKMVRPTFTQAIEEHWKNKPFMRNRVK